MDKHLISRDSTLIEALGKLNSLSGGRMTLLVTDGDMHMCGTLTDGDVRRALLGGVGLDAPVRQAMHVSYSALREGWSRWAACAKCAGAAFSSSCA